VLLKTILDIRDWCARARPLIAIVGYDPQYHKLLTFNITITLKNSV
jgi:hypothetical protein